MEKQLIPQLRFPNFQGKWEKVIISKIADKITDGTHDTPKPIKEGIPFLTAIHVKDGKIDFDNCYYLSEEEHNKIYKRCNPEFGDLLMVNIGAGTATSAMVNVNYEFSLKNVALIKPNRTKIYPSFFAQVQRKNSDRLRHQISSGGAQPFLSLKAIGKLKLNIPTLPEQQKIASFLTDVDDKITKLTKKKDLLEQYKKGIMQKIFSQETDKGGSRTPKKNKKGGEQLRFKDDNEFPKWEVKKFDECLKSMPTKQYQIKSSDYQIKGKYKVIDQGQKFVVGYFDNESYLFKNCPVIIFGDHTTILKYIDFEFVVGADGTKILKGINNQNLKYLFYYLSFYNISTEGYKRHFSILREVKIKLPCIEEQTKIANFLSDIDVKIETLNTKIENSKAFKKGLLQQMFV